MREVVLVLYPSRIPKAAEVDDNTLDALIAIEKFFDGRCEDRYSVTMIDDPSERLADAELDEDFLGSEVDLQLKLPNGWPPVQDNVVEIVSKNKGMDLIWRSTAL